MTKKLTLFLFLLSAFASTGVFAQNEEIKIELLEIIIPANMDDHGKFGLATPEFEMTLGFYCGNGAFSRYTKYRNFTLPANKTDKPIRHKLKGIKLTISPHYVQECKDMELSTVTLEEREFAGSDTYAEKEIKGLLYSKNSPLKPNGSHIITFGQNQRGEADWTFAGFGNYKPFVVIARVTSKIYK